VNVSCALVATLENTYLSVFVFTSLLDFTRVSMSFLTKSVFCRTRVTENGVLRRIFDPKAEKVGGGWRRLHNEELHNLYTSSSIMSCHGE
jgi:hypothetical protein